jgi:RNA methyltransferase, TrmH family
LAGFLFVVRHDIWGQASSCVIMHLMLTITGHSNPKIKQLRALRRRKERDETGLCVVEGLFHIGEALAAFVAGVGPPIEYICYAPDLLAGEFGHRLVAQSEEMRIPTYRTSAEILAGAADKENPQGMLAVARQRRIRLADISPAELSWAVALVTPQDPGNVGTILRTIDAVGASGLILLGNGVDPYHPTALRAAMGTTFWRPVVKGTFEEFAAWSQHHNYHIYGTSAHGRTDYRAAHFEKPLILLMGSEREGLTSEQRALCHALLRLPMHGRAGSLNLAVATGIFLYQILEKSPLNPL